MNSSHYNQTYKLLKSFPLNDSLFPGKNQEEMLRRQSLPITDGTAAAVHLSSPFSENNTSPLRRKSFSFGPYNKSKNDGVESQKSPGRPSLLRPPSSSLQRTSDSSSPSVPDRKSLADSPRRLQKQSSSDDLQSRGLWPSSKKLNPSADSEAETFSETFARDINDDGRIDRHAERPAASYKFSTFSSRQRDQPGGDRGNRSLRYHIGKQHVERSMIKPGTPPSPSSSSSSSSSGPPPPPKAKLSGRFSFRETSLTRKKSDYEADFRSMEFEKTENTGPLPRVSLSSVRRPKSPAQRPGSPAKGKSGGVGSLISQGLNNLFRRKSFQGVYGESVMKPRETPTASAAGSPGKERAVKLKGAGSPGREATVPARNISSPSRGASAVEGEMQQWLRIMHNYLIQWRFVNAGTVVVDANVKVNAEGTLVSTLLGLSDLQNSVAKKQILLEKEKLKFKLNQLLLHQTKGLERWSAAERLHLAALSATKDSLHAAVCRLPVTDNAKVDPHSLATSLQQATNLAEVINGTLAKNHSRAQATVPLVAELAQIAAKEKPLLEECVELLGLISSLQVHEESLRSQLIQLKSQPLMRCTDK